MTQDPLRLRAAVALTDLLAEISTDDGYYFTLSGAVFRGRALFGEGDPETMVAILEKPAGEDHTEEPDDEDIQSAEWKLFIQGFAKDDFDHPTDPATKLLTDVKRKLLRHRRQQTRERGGNLLGQGGKVTRLRIGYGVVRPADEVSPQSYFYLPITLHLIDDLLA